LPLQLPARRGVSTLVPHLDLGGFSMSCSRLGSFFLLPLALAATVAVAAEPDYDRLQRIRQAGFTDSRVLELAEELTDSIGARLTGSPAPRQAKAWARDHFTDW